MNFYTQTMVELVGALGAAMVVGNTMAILRRRGDRAEARNALQTTSRASRQTTALLAKDQVKRGTATLAIAPLKRSILFIAMGALAFIWAAATLLS